jgi:formylglycine-generating enzyme required for sulfatase activity
MLPCCCLRAQPPVQTRLQPWARSRRVGVRGDSGLVLWGLLCAFGCMTNVRKPGELEQTSPAGHVEPTAVPFAPATPANTVAEHALDAGARTPTFPEVAPAAHPSPTEAPPGMLLVPGGTFTMGADVGGEEDEHPAHTVTIETFWLDVTEVTVHEYHQCTAAGVCRASRDRFENPGAKLAETRFRQANQPITGISWDDAHAYCSFRDKRLPREAEWERAARGEDGRRYPWGNAAPDRNRHGCFARALGTAEGTTCAVGSFPAGAGPYGHHDLAGNVWEWMADYYDPFAYRRPGAAQGEPGECQQILETQDWLRQNQRQGFTGTNPIPVSCERVLRGGAFNCPASGLRSSNRVHHPGDWRLLMAGARCAKDRHAQREDAVGSTVP